MIGEVEVEITFAIILMLEVVFVYIGYKVLRMLING